MGKIRVTQINVKNSEMNTNGQKINSELISRFSPNIITGTRVTALDHKTALEIAMQTAPPPKIVTAMCRCDMFEAITREALQDVVDNMRTKATKMGVDPLVFTYYLNEWAAAMGLS